MVGLPWMIDVVPRDTRDHMLIGLFNARIIVLCGAIIDGRIRFRVFDDIVEWQCF